MYRGFNLISHSWDPGDKYYQIGKSIFDKDKENVKLRIKEFLEKDGAFNGARMMSDWFPEIKADIFLSHSHKNEKFAISLAGYLKENLGVRTFIDSCIWGDSSQLLRKLDNDHCLNEGGKTYNYWKRNNSTSHIHMMLATSLANMIDKTEALFFLNTPESISTSDVFDHTYSPWIYAEIVFSQLLNHKIPERSKTRERLLFSKNEIIQEELKVKYEANLSHLNEIKLKEITKWIDVSKKRNADKNNELSLDLLYEISPIKSQLFLKG